MTHNLKFIKAGAGDMDLLVELRSEVLRDVFSLPAGYDTSSIEHESRNYYMEAFADGSHVAYIAMDGEKIAGCGAVCFYRVMPSVHNRSGLCGCIMNMYTRPEYRKQGIASQIVRLLVDDAKARGVETISLETTAAGRSVYLRQGFSEQKDLLALIES